MVFEMASVKVTVTVEEEQLRTMRDLVAHGKASSLAGFVQHAIDVALDDVAGWQRTLEEAAVSGGPLSRPSSASCWPPPVRQILRMHTSLSAPAVRVTKW